jgi:hypothetical protein
MLTETDRRPLSFARHAFDGPEEKDEPVCADQHRSYPMRAKDLREVGTCGAERVFAELRLPSSPEQHGKYVRCDLAHLAHCRNLPNRVGADQPHQKLAEKVRVPPAPARPTSMTAAIGSVLLGCLVIWSRPA